MEVSNIEAKVIKWLSDTVPDGWQVSADIPEVRPDKMIVVERTGGPRRDKRIEWPEILISIYCADSALEASNMALFIDGKIDQLLSNNSISRVRRTSMIRLDDLIIKCPRYQSYYEFTHLL